VELGRNGKRSDIGKKTEGWWKMDGRNPLWEQHPLCGSDGSAVNKELCHQQLERSHS